MHTTQPNFETAYTLTPTQLEDLEGLVSACHKHDTYRLPTYPHILSKTREHVSSVLSYKEGLLIGFVSAYFFYKDGCEITLMVHPQFRHQHIAGQLLKQLLPLIRSSQIRYFIFSTLPSQDKSFLSKQGFKYHESEYEMARYTPEKYPPKSFNLAIKQAQFEHINDLVKIDTACFDTKGEDITQRFMTILSDTNYLVLLGFYFSQPVAKAHIQWLDHGAKLSDIAVSPSFQNKGLGKEIIAYAINRLMDLGKTPITLDVLSDNQNAFKLYQTFGFEIINQVDYWKIDPNRLAISR